MPWLQVNVIEGRDEEVLLELIAGLSKTTSETLGVPIETVRVIVNEYAPERWGVGGRPIDLQGR